MGHTARGTDCGAHPGACLRLGLSGVQDSFLQWVSPIIWGQLGGHIRETTMLAVVEERDREVEGQKSAMLQEL